jgi:hypothetical protein
MNRRAFLATVSGAAVAGGVKASGLEAVSDLLREAPAEARRVAVFIEPGFPAIDVRPVAEATLRAALTEFDAAWLGADALSAQLTRSRFDLLITPYGSAFPLCAWTAIRAFLDAGGHWINLGGVPLAVPVDGGPGGWRTQIRQTAYHRTLGITQAFATEIPASASWEPSAQFPFAAALAGQISAPRAFGFHVRLTETKSFADEDGSDGPREAALAPLLSAVRVEKDSAGVVRRWPVAAPVVMMDRLVGARAGARWIFVTATGAIAAEAVRALAAAAVLGGERLVVQPLLACVRDAEAPRVASMWIRPGIAPDTTAAASVAIDVVGRSGVVVASCGGPVSGRGASIDRSDTIASLPLGFYEVRARLERTGQPSVLASSGFWVFDAAVMARGMPVTADAWTLRRSGKPFPVAGTTYMASDVHRQFLLEPNPGVWDRDFASMRAAGVNFIRTGIWTGWSRYAGPDGRVNEAALRALDAFMLTASHYDIAVCFTFFAFVPPLWGGVNPYLDPTARAAQKRFISSVVDRYRAMPHVTWDLINEPSFCSPSQLWVTRPNGDEHERRRWAQWLETRYAAETPEARERMIQESWRGAVGEGLGLPGPADFTDTNLFGSNRPLKAHDYRLFAQDMFHEWVDDLSGAIRAAAGPGHLVTVGQDEGGTVERPSNQLFGASVDLTSIHTWWFNDDLLWDAIVSKHPTRPNLVQETGLMFYEKADGQPWRSEREAHDLLERKLALALGVGGAGFINWIWNANPYMASDNEAAIGLFRADGSAKPEFDAWRGVAAFAHAAAPHLDGRERESVLLVIPQSNLFSVRTTAVEATKRAVRVMHYHCRIPMAAVGELNLAAWPARPRLAILPCPRLLTRGAWSTLRAWIEQGTTLVVTGPFDEDEHWLPTGRMRDLGLPDSVRPVMPHETVTREGTTWRLPFRGEKLQRIEAAGDVGADASALREVVLGAGKILWTGIPVELADATDATESLYRLAIRSAGLTGLSLELTPGDSSVLAFPARYRNAILFTVVSESATASPRVTIRDPESGLSLSVTVGAGRAALALVDRSSRTIVADYPSGCAAAASS